MFVSIELAQQYSSCLTMDERTTNKVAKLARLLQFPAEARDLLIRALTHRSVGEANNERLEFLGDAALNFIIAIELYNMLPQADEGTLTRLRAKLVCKETLAELAESIDLGNYLILGPGERKTGGGQRSSILADAFEAIIGALFCSQDFAITKEKILGYYREKIAKVTSEKLKKDPKTSLQELLQGKKLPLPLYEVVKIVGEQHDQTFHVVCKTVLCKEDTLGVGTSRRQAEQDAAAKVLALISGDLYAR